MEMTYPPPLKSKANPNAAAANDVDYSMTSPLKADGSDFPCKGYLSLVGTPQGKAVATWVAGGRYNFSVAGGAPHGGGSCQAALSFDCGKTFRVVHSYEGGCPGLGTSSAFDFQLPGDVPATQGAVFAWTWFNKLGNREMYMNCAVVDVTAGSSGRGGGVSFASRPALFVANLGNGCKTVDSANVKFPDPGPDVDAGLATPPTGSCGATAAAGSGSGSAGSGTGAGTGSGAGSGSSSAGASSGGSSTSVVTPSPSHDSGGCEASSQPAGAGTGGDSGKGWKPGNDWPAGFNSAVSSKASRYHFLAIFSWAAVFAYCIL
jgi:hypothetical protein